MVVEMGTLLGSSPRAAAAQLWSTAFTVLTVPPILADTISYGRAWQMLRSRGAGSNATGPCDPPQMASSCNCSTTKVLPTNIGVVDDHDTSAMPRCVPSPLCGVDDIPSPAQGPAALKVAILLFIDMQRQNMRFPVGSCVACLRRGYGKAVRELVRILISLRAVGTKVPIHILASGERYPDVEAKLAARFDVTFLTATAPPMVVPEWASKWARGSFAKLRALALTQYDKLLVLDNDDVVLRNVDHLLAPSTPTPAAVFGWKCYPRRELRAATLVLTPSTADFERATRLLNEPSTAVYDDLGEQSVWRRLYPLVHELPVRYAAMRTADLPGPEWKKVAIVHDAHLIHDVSRTGWHEAQMTAAVTTPDQEATKLFKKEFAARFADPPKVDKRAGRGRARAMRKAQRQRHRAS